MNYQLTPNPKIIVRYPDNALIPVDSNNADYIEFLKWQNAGNTPLPYQAPQPQIIPNFNQFLNSVLGSDLYQKVLTQSIAKPEVNVAFTRVMGALVLAATGNINIMAIQTGLTDLVSAMTLTSGDLIALQLLLQESNLTEIVSLNN